MPRMAEFVFDARTDDSSRGEIGLAMLEAANAATRFSIPVDCPRRPPSADSTLGEEKGLSMGVTE